MKEDVWVEMIVAQILMSNQMPTPKIIFVNKFFLCGILDKISNI